MDNDATQDQQPHEAIEQTARGDQTSDNENAENLSPNALGQDQSPAKRLRANPEEEETQ